MVPGNRSQIRGNLINEIGTLRAERDKNNRSWTKKGKLITCTMY